MKKQTIKAAGSYETIHIVATSLDTDPELADEYLFNFAREWGKEALRSLVRCLEFTHNNDLPDTMREVLEHDLFIKQNSGKELMCLKW